MFAGDPDPYTADSDRTNMDDLIVTPSGGVTAQRRRERQGRPADNRASPDAHRQPRPVVRAPANRTLPIQTPFTLRGSGRDRDGDKLTYLWEQNDDGGRDGTTLVDNSKKNGPLFRVFGPTPTSRTRTPATARRPA